MTDTEHGTPDWYRDAIIYQLHVRSFYDSDGDGIGDFRGLTEKLDYLQDLGVTALWLMPFYPSPLRDDGYDISDYRAVNPSYGTLRDFRTFLNEAHKRDLKVITELVINHTSDQHAWFQRARTAKPGSAARDYYVWSDTPEKYRDARIIFQDFEPSNWTWDPEAKAYYWHRFYSHQPDLNFDNPRVRREIIAAMDFWLKMGVDGMRLDAVPYLFEREGTNCENLPETHAFLKELRHHLDSEYSDRMLLAEANQWPEDAVAYFGDGDECNMAFHFPLMPRLFMAVRREDRYPIIDILEQTPPIPESTQWAIFLRNHDELTLEMVTDEERDYMYRSYARDPQMRVNLGIRRRLAPLLGNNRRQTELMNALLFSMPGTPIIYYGDEIGMGDNIYLGDRDAVRTPMQWSSDRNAGFSRAHPHQLFLPAIIDPEYHYEFVNVETQQNNLTWLLWWMKRLIALRKQFRAFGSGSLEMLYPDNRKVLAFVRRFGEEVVLVVANLSRFVQYVNLDLADFAGMHPIEVFGRNRFPVISDAPYTMALGPHGFYWFSLEKAAATVDVTAGDTLAGLAVNADWLTLDSDRGRKALEQVLPRALRWQRWFGGKAREIARAHVREMMPLGNGRSPAPPYRLAIVQVDYYEGEPERYQMPLMFMAGDDLPSAEPGRSPVIAQIRNNGQQGYLVDATMDEGFRTLLLSMLRRRTSVRSGSGTLSGHPMSALRRLTADIPAAPESQLLGAEQSNTSIIYDDSLIMKLYRRVDEGINPDVEINRHLTERLRFPSTPKIGGTLEYRGDQRPTTTLAILQELVHNEGDAWEYTLDELDTYFDRVFSLRERAPDVPMPPIGIDGEPQEIPESAWHIIGGYLDSAALLGQRTAELHVALSRDLGDARFRPEPFSQLYQRSLYQAMQADLGDVSQLLRRKMPTLAEELQPVARRVLDRDAELRRVLRRITGAKMGGFRTRTHGDYHLGQVLYTGQDFAVIDFEGEPARPLSERSIKRSPLRDVAGMLRSFHYAAWSRLVGEAGTRMVRPEDMADAVQWARLWHRWVRYAFLSAYTPVALEAGILSADAGERERLLRAFIAEKAIYEVRYELNNRPDWVNIPLHGLLDLLDEEAAGA